LLEREAETVRAAVPFPLKQVELRQETLGRTHHCIARNCWQSGHTILAGNNHRNHLGSTMVQGVEQEVAVVLEQVEPVQPCCRWSQI
jgi:hypothetical protein